MEIEFKSILELYERIKPALKAKANELKRIKYDYIKEEDIWNYLKEYKWKKSRGLDLFEMTNDILNLDVIALDSYVKEVYRKSKREVNLEDDVYGK